MPGPLSSMMISSGSEMRWLTPCTAMRMPGRKAVVILISPFVKRGYVSSRVYDHASVLKLIETRWGLDPLTVRDAEANDMMADLSFVNPVLTAPAIDVSSGPFTVPCG